MSGYISQNNDKPDDSWSGYATYQSAPDFDPQQNLASATSTETFNLKPLDCEENQVIDEDHEVEFSSKNRITQWQAGWNVTNAIQVSL